jgi:hypothetical protein
MDLRIIKPEVCGRAVFFLFSSSMTTKYAVLLLILPLVFFLPKSNNGLL